MDPILCSAYHWLPLQKQKNQVLWTYSDESRYSSGQKQMSENIKRKSAILEYI
jgi:hypothetical protein